MELAVNEEEARAEIEDIAALLEEAGKTMVRLRERREQLTPLSEATGRRVAVAAHAVLCAEAHPNHPGGAGCTWKSQKPDAWGTGPRRRWFLEGRKRLEASGETAEDLIQALRTLASPGQLEWLEADTAEVERVEREALEGKGDEE